MTSIDNAVLPEGSLILVTVRSDFLLHLHLDLELMRSLRFLNRAQTVHQSLPSVSLLCLILTDDCTGFVASHIVEQLLVRGYRVRGTTRHGTKLDVLKKRWDDKYPGQFQVAVVKDITQEGAFDKAIKGQSQLLFSLLFCSLSLHISLQIALE